MNANESKAVFLSYASQDSEAARKICEALRAAGIEVWFDQSELRGGDAWDQRIRKQIKECALFVPVISANTQARREGYFRREWKQAAARTYDIADGTPFLVPVVIDETRDASALVPEEFFAVQWTRLASGQPLDSFSARLQKLLAGDGTPALMETNRRTTRPPAQQSRRLLAGVGVGAAIVLGLVIARPWERPPAGAPGSAAKTAAPVSESQRLVQQARALQEPWSLDTREDLGAVQLLLKRALEVDPTDAAAWAASAELSSKFMHYGFDRTTARRDLLRRQAEMAGRLGPGSLDADVAMASWLFHSDRQEADRVLRIVLQKSADHRWALRMMGCNLRFFQRWDEALSYLRRAAALPGRDPWPWWEQAVLFSARRQISEMENALEQTLARAPVGRAYVMKAMSQLHRVGDVAGARKTLEAAPPGILDEDRGAFIAAKVAFWERQPDRAFVALGRLSSDWMEDNTFVGPRRFLTGWAHHLAGRTEAAEAEWRAALQTVVSRQADDAASPLLRSWQARLLALLGQRREAEAVFRVYEQYLAAPSQTESWGPSTRYFDQIHVNLLLGRKSEALDLVRRQHGQWQGAATMTETYATFKLDPLFDGLRSEPEFVAFLAEAEARDRSTRPDETARAAPGVLNTKPSDAAVADAKSVAVLAFANLSDDTNNEYFSDGISEELLNVLAKVPGLKVSARTSAFSFKAKNVPIPEIARQLGVAYVVEGSVRKVGNRVRITAQLIKAADGFHVWSDNFDRELKDIFAVQDEIAGLIAGNLSLRLGAGASSARPAVNPEVYRLYLEARQAWNLRNETGYVRAESLLNQALTLDPNFSRAHAALSDVCITRGQDAWTLGTLDQRDGLELRKAAEAAERAVALDRESAEAHASLGNVLKHQWKYPEAEVAYRRAIQLNPNYASAHQWFGRLLMDMGHFDEATAELQRAVELDPLSARIADNLSDGYLRVGQPAEALRLADRALSLQPDSPQALVFRAMALADLGRTAEAIQTASQVKGDKVSDLVAYVMAIAGDAKAAESALRSLHNGGEVGRIATLLALGRKEEALATLAPRAIHTNTVSRLYSWAVFDPVRNDPRFRKAMADTGLAEYYERARAWWAVKQRTSSSAKAAEDTKDGGRRTDPPSLRGGFGEAGKKDAAK